MEGDVTTADVAELLRHLKPIRELRMRAAALARRLAEMPPDRGARALERLVARAPTAADPALRALLDTLRLALSEPALDYATRAALYRAASERSARPIARLFFDASPPSESEHQSREHLAPERAAIPRGRTLTLGERKSLARSQRRDLLEHLVRDPHPEVVAILLGNPHLTERDVVAVATRRPQSPDALAVIAGDPHWSVRYRVKRALVYNPHTPVHVGVRVALTLRDADLREVRGDAGLSETLREHSAELLALRAAPGS